MWSVSLIGDKLLPCTLTPGRQLYLVLSTLERLADNYKVTGWETVTPAEAYKELQGNLFVFAGTSVMCISISRPWFSKEDVLVEEFVGQGIGLHKVTKIMRLATGVMGAKRFVVGTRAAVNQRHSGLAKLYEREGLTVSAVELMGVVDGKEITEGGS